MKYCIVILPWAESIASMLDLPCILAYQKVLSSSKFIFRCFPTDFETLIWIHHMDSRKDNWNKIKQSKPVLKDYYNNCYKQQNQKVKHRYMRSIEQSGDKNRWYWLCKITGTLHTRMSSAANLAVTTLNVYVTLIILENKLLIWCSL